LDFKFDTELILESIAADTMSNIEKSTALEESSNPGAGAVSRRSVLL